MSDLIEWLRGVLRQVEAEHRLMVALSAKDGRTGAEAPPAWVPADIAAKRAILDAGGPHRGHEECDEIGERIKFPGWETPTCSDNCGPDVWWTVVKTLATAYADRPGYREEWRP